MPKPGYKLPVVLVLLLLAALAIFVHRRASLLVAPPRTFTHQTPSDFGIVNWQEVSFTTEDGVRLSGWYIPPQVAPGAALIFVHGLGSHRGSMLDQAAVLAQEGYGALLFDLRAHGLSHGRKSSLGQAEVADVAAALRFLQTQPEVDASRIGLVGHSMGGAIAIRAAVKLPEIRLVVAESVYTNFSENAARLAVAFARLPKWTGPLVLPWAEQIAGVDSDNLAPIHDIAHLAPRPVLLIQGGQDGTIPSRNGGALFGSAVAPKDRLVIPQAGHNNLFLTDPALMTKRLRRFLAENFSATD